MKFKCTKGVFVFFVITVNISCSEKGVFMPVKSAYLENVCSIRDTLPLYRDPAYPISIIDKSPFKKATFRNEEELSMLLMFELFFKKENKDYLLLSNDDKYIYYRLLKENDGELYAEYNPNKEDNKAINYRNMGKKVIRALNKRSIVSISRVENKNTYIVKLFEVIEN